MTDQNDNPLDLPAIEGTQVSPAVAVASVALSLSLKYLDSTVIKDGTMYQQMKLEGKEIKDIDLRNVFEVAKQFEAHLMSAPGRLSEMIFDAVIDGAKEDKGDGSFVNRPAHPGEIIRGEILVKAGVTPEEAASLMNVELAYFNAVLDGRQSVTPELAEEIGTQFGYYPDTLMEVQKIYDDAKENRKKDAHPQE